MGEDMSKDRDTIDYGSLMHDAMRGLIRKVLEQVAREGLPGQHHFFVTFASNHPGVRLSDWLAERFPETMTIVMQHWFADLEVGEEGFGVTLNFNDQPENMFIPYDAIRTFVDPSVEFGLKFETREAPEGDGPGDPDSPGPGGGKADAEARPEEAGGGDRPTTGEAEVVSLDAFRK